MPTKRKWFDQDEKLEAKPRQEYKDILVPGRMFFVKVLVIRTLDMNLKHYYFCWFFILQFKEQFDNLN